MAVYYARRPNGRFWAFRPFPHDDEKWQWHGAVTRHVTGVSPPTVTSTSTAPVRFENAHLIIAAPNATH